MVDYGETVEVNLQDIRKITEKFLHVPFQAVECRLFTAVENEEMPVEEAKAFFEEMYLCKDFNAKVM